MFRADMTFKLKSIAVLLDILCIPVIICSPVKDYEFVKEARDAPAERRYDYIIVGGGTAGCPLAATLSQNFSVLLLERGGSPYGNINISRIENFYLSLADVSASSPSQKFVSEDGVISTRGRVLGGSSCLNAGFYSRASPDYVRSVGWDGELVNRSYGWVEKIVAYRPNVAPWQSAVRDALLDVGISPYNGFTYDHLYGTKVGGTTFDANGDRRTAADLLEYANPRNLLVLLHASVHRVLFTTRGKSRPVADGVMYRDAHGVEHVAYLKVRDKEAIQSEIIISAGALGSPQLLLLSGIGPAEHLKSLGIPVVVDRPAVGEGMADNPMNAIYIPTTKPVEMSLIQVVGIAKFGSYIEASSGIHHSKYGTMAPSEEKGQPLWGGFVLEKVEGPLSRGRLVLRNADVDDNPSVAFKYFDDPRDLRRCVEGITTIEKMIRSRGLAEFTYPKVSFAQLREISSRVLKNLIPKHTNDSTSLEQFCRDTVTTIWHYHGGCHVERVVDRRYRVLGVDALRVIDGSTFNSSPGTNPQATVMMLGRYMGVTILKERLGAAASI